MKLATWNVNSIRAREQFVLEWLRRVEPDVLCMQETKVVDDDFPTEEFQRLGYEIAMAGQKTYNGVAILSRQPLTDVVVSLDGDGDDAERRFIAATIAGIRVVTVYVPNGKHADSTSFGDKLDWLRRLKTTLESDVNAGDDRLLCGDFNIAPEERDLWNPDQFRGRVHFHPDEHRALAAILDLGFVDAYRLHEQETGKYSWWDYRGGAFHKNQGLRIDYVLLSRSLAERCTAAWMDRHARKKSAAGVPSDHVPVVVEL